MFRDSTQSELQTPPSTPEFASWSPEQVAPLLAGQTVALATSGTSRWYFLEYGDVQAGYSTRQQFEHYGRKVIERVMEIAAMIFEDGIRTLLIVGFGGGQANRDAPYRENMRWAYEMLIDETTRQLYDQHNTGVMFRGDWTRIFNDLDAQDLTARFHQIEQQTIPERDRWLIWYVPDDYIPASLIPLVQRSIEQTGRAPAQADLGEAYYGRRLEQVDILIGNNKPIASGIYPPFMDVRDMYFTVSPITYLQRSQWRHLLYDHLFSRRGHYRDFQALSQEDLEEMRTFYRLHRGDILGLGAYHAASQTWRPLPLSSEDLPQDV